MMRDDIILKLQRIIEGNDRITWDLFPEIYDGFLEADELSKAEDRMLQFVASAVLTCTNDKLISTASVDRIAEYESALGVSGSGLSLDARRQQVIDYINRSRTINESTLHALCQSLALDCTVYERTDSQALTLGVFTEEDAEDGALPAVGIVGEIRPTVPQNLALYAGVETSFDRPLVVNHAHFSALWAGLGVVEWHEPPEPPEPPVTGNAICGSMGADYSESVLGEVSERIERCGIAFTGLLRENVIPESGRMERGGIGFTGLLRENFIPESGVVEEYVAPSMYDVWIESVDSANNVVVALRSVFTGLTAARATTIVNNAPTYLSRYNSYLNNRGGPYTQADAVTMRDNLQSRIPAGDTSTFGIRPAST